MRMTPLVAAAACAVVVLGCRPRERAPSDLAPSDGAATSAPQSAAARAASPDVELIQKGPLGMLCEIGGVSESRFMLDRDWAEMVREGRQTRKLCVTLFVPLFESGHLTRQELGKLLGAPARCSDVPAPAHMALAVMSAGDDKYRPVKTMPFMWYGPVGFGFLSEADDSACLAVAYDPTKEPQSAAARGAE